MEKQVDNGRQSFDFDKFQSIYYGEQENQANPDKESAVFQDKESQETKTDFIERLTDAKHDKQEALDLPAPKSLELEEERKIYGVSREEAELEAEKNPESDAFDVSKYTKGLVPEYDDADMHCITFRSIFIGSVFNIILSVTGAIFKFRTNRLNIPAVIAAIAAYPMGVFMAKVLPYGSFNPGQFTPKEQIIATVIGASGAWLPAGLENVVALYHHSMMNNEDVNVWNSLLWIICTQLLGFGLAGVARKFLVHPPQMLWPRCLGTVALVSSFHNLDTGKDEEEDEGPPRYTMDRFKYFWIVTGCAFIYAWFPSYIFPALVSIPIVCLASASKEWKFLGSPASKTGIGIGTLSLDWNYLTGSQMTSPYWATCNTLFGNVIWWYILIPTIFYTNAFGRDTSLHVQKSPFPYTINTVSLFSSKTNSTISALDVMDPKTYDLNVTAYEQHAPLRLASAFAAFYGVSFLALTATVVHVVLWHGKDIYKQAKDNLYGTETILEDIHSRLMRAYTDFSEYVYLGLLGIMVVLNIITCAITPFELPWYYILLSIPLSVTLLVPIGTIAAVSGKPVELSIFSQFIIGLASPGKTVWLMSFKTFGLNGIKVAVELLRNLKLGRYMHIDPKAMVYAQFYGTVLGGLVNTIVTFMVMDVWFVNLLGTEEWSYSAYKRFYSTSTIFGAIGPARFFGPGSLYQPLLWFFPLGIILPILPWLGNKYWPSKRWQLINIPLIAAMRNPESKQIYLLSTFLVATASQWYAFNYQYEWFKRYNYLTSVAMTVGSSAVILLVVLLKTNGLTMPDWAGTVNLDSYCVGDPEDGVSSIGALAILQSIAVLILVVTIVLVIRSRR